MSHIVLQPPPPKVSVDELLGQDQVQLLIHCSNEWRPLGKGGPELQLRLWDFFFIQCPLFFLKCSVLFYSCCIYVQVLWTIFVLEFHIFNGTCFLCFARMEINSVSGYAVDLDKQTTVFIFTDRCAFFSIAVRDQLASQPLSWNVSL